MQKPLVLFVYSDKKEASSVLKSIEEDKTLKQYVHIVQHEPNKGILRYNTSGLKVKKLPAFVIKKSPSDQPYIVDVSKHNEIFQWILREYQGIIAIVIDCQERKKMEYSACVDESLLLQVYDREKHVIYEKHNLLESAIFCHSHLFKIREPGEHHFICDVHGGETKVTVRTRTQENAIILESIEI